MDFDGWNLCPHFLVLMTTRSVDLYDAAKWPNEKNKKQKKKQKTNLSEPTIL